MRHLFRFLMVWGAWMALAAGMFLILLWAFSINSDPNDEEAASSLLWSIYWPFIWLYRWMSAPVRRRMARSNAPETTHADARAHEGQRFRTVREAKDYLAGAIVAEAGQGGTPLTEVERKMLYFSETGWTLPDMSKVNAEFDRDCDQDEYEHKIAAIIRRIQSRLTNEKQLKRLTWEAALEKLSRGDHYLLVLISAANPMRRGVRHNWKMLVVALLLLAVGAVYLWFRQWLRDQ